MRIIADVIAATRNHGTPLPKPLYEGGDVPGQSEAQFYRDHVSPRLAFMVASMKDHTTDEGYQLALALRAGGYELWGHGFNKSSDVSLGVSYNPSVVVMQDKREWMGRTAGPGFDFKEKFTYISELKGWDHIFRGTVLKDAHSDHDLHIEAANEIGCHFWIVYYHPDVVAAQAPYARKEHMVRTYHSVDRNIVPEFTTVRSRAGVLSGALSRAYPLRTRLALEWQNGRLKNIDHVHHPNYGRNHCCTPDYLRMLSTYRVAICTSSRFGYAVRKIIEATACGCTVITDLPADEIMPEIDGNCVRIDSDMTPSRVDALVGDLATGWNPIQQEIWADRAKRYYDYRVLGKKLGEDIEALRRRYNDPI